VTRTKEQLPQEPRPLNQSEWDQYLCELAMQELVEQYGPILREEDEQQS
jgi:hypothetical protein